MNLKDIVGLSLEEARKQVPYQVKIVEAPILGRVECLNVIYVSLDDSGKIATAQQRATGITI